MRLLRFSSSLIRLTCLLSAILASAGSLGARNPSGTQPSSEPSSHDLKQATVVVDPATGNPRLVRFAEALPVRDGSDTTDTALQLLRFHSRTLGIEKPGRDLRWIRNQPDPTGGEQVIFSQTYRGLPVFGTLVRVHVDADGAVKTVNGTIVSDIDLDPVPRLDAHLMESLAMNIVAKATDRDPSSLDVAPATLLVYREGLVRGRPGANHLAWEVVVSSTPGLREILYLDAHDGRLIDQRSDIHHLQRAIHLGHYPNTIWSEGDTLPFFSGEATRDAEVNELVAAAGDAHRLFANLSGGAYLSFDGADTVMNAIYDADSLDCPNAQESGGFTSYCEGMVSDDVAAHEWTHAYTEWTHGLLYQWQPGALNEAYSDIFGELADQLNGRGTDSPGGIRLADNCSSAGGNPQPTLQITGPSTVAGAYPRRRGGLQSGRSVGVQRRGRADRRRRRRDQ